MCLRKEKVLALIIISKQLLPQKMLLSENRNNAVQRWCSYEEDQEKASATLEPDEYLEPKWLR